MGFGGESDLVVLLSYLRPPVHCDCSTLPLSASLLFPYGTLLLFHSNIFIIIILTNSSPFYLYVSFSFHLSSFILLLLIFLMPFAFSQSLLKFITDFIPIEAACCIVFLVSTKSTTLAIVLICFILCR